MYFLLGFNNDLLSPTQVFLDQSNATRVQYSITIPPMATSQHLLHITYLHLNNDSVPEKGSSEPHENNITIITAATTAKQFFMKNRIRIPILMGFT